MERRAYQLRQMREDIAFQYGDRVWMRDILMQASGVLLGVSVGAGVSAAIFAVLLWLSS